MLGQPNAKVAKESRMSRPADNMLKCRGDVREGKLECLGEDEG